MKHFFIAFGILLCKLILLGQTPDTLNFPEVGKKMPGFVIQHIKYYSKNKATLDEFKGKWLLLDFWNKSCGACIVSFPHTNEIQKNLGAKVQIMLVAIQDKEGQIEPMYAKFKERQNLIMPCAFDSMLANRFDIYTAPHSILIDDKGIVRCITQSINMTDMKDFLAGNTPELPKTYRRMHDDEPTINEHYNFDPNKPFLVRDNGGNDSDFLFRSVLSSWNNRYHSQSIPSNIKNDVLNGRFQVLGAPLEWLYNYAYFGYGTWNFFDFAIYGKYYNHPILEIRDSSRFKYSFKYNRNIYSYSLSMPASMCTEEAMKVALQRDLTTYFGLEATVETRNCPCWKLVASGGAKQKLKTKGGEAFFNEPIFHASLSMHNQRVAELIRWIWIAQQDKIILDDTGISGNIDIDLDCVPTDMIDLKRALITNGLDLVMGEKKMQVVVIREKNSNSQVK